MKGELGDFISRSGPVNIHGFKISTEGLQVYPFHIIFLFVGEIPELLFQFGVPCGTILSPFIQREFKAVRVKQFNQIVHRLSDSEFLTSDNSKY